MPDTQYREVLISVVASMVLFLVLATIILWFVFNYLRRRRRQEQQLLELRRQFQEQSLQSQLEIQEQTFDAISQEIHDNVGQVLSLAKVQVNIILQTDVHQPELLEAIKENIGKAMSDLRDLSSSLNSERLRSCRLHEAIIQEADRINRTGVIGVKVEVDGVYRDIQPQRKLIVFRIVQESLQNCLKHAQAKNIGIRCAYGPEDLIIRIEDDGVGFDATASPGGGSGQGLINIRTRVRLTGGNHFIQSAPREGTRIILTIPYE
ncbi:MAG TPA: ATP-binding protein [Puia sp.]|nr:ATP-binding protein [Puia sp.]